MNEKRLRILFRLLAHAARWLTAYPIALVLFCGILKKPERPPVFLTLAAMAAAAVSCALTALVQGKNVRVILLRQGATYWQLQCSRGAAFLIRLEFSWASFWQSVQRLRWNTISKALIF